MIHFSRENRSLASRRCARGDWVCLIPGVYADAHLDIRTQVQNQLPGIMAYLGWSGALAYRSGLDAPEKRMDLVLVGDRSIRVFLGDFQVKMWRGTPGELSSEGLMAWSGEIRQPTVVRALLENLSMRRADQKKIASAQDFEVVFCADLEKRCARLGLRNGVSDFVSEAARLSVALSRLEEFKVLSEKAKLWANVRGEQDLYDFSEVQSFKKMKSACLTLHLPSADDSNLQIKEDASSNKPIEISRVLDSQLFFEAYFSNFIEGTRLDMDDAARIAGLTPETPKKLGAPLNESARRDQLDFIKTLEALKIQKQNLPVWDTYEDWSAWLKKVHADLFSHRSDTIVAGSWKQNKNRVGGRIFVDPDNVDGTLRHAFDMAKKMPPGQGRAIFLSTAFVCIHPFEDGNGRISRMILNIERERAQHPRLIVFNVSRGDYLLALEAWSSNQDLAPLDRFFKKNEDHVTSVNWSGSLQGVSEELKARGAFKEDRHAQWSAPARSSKPSP